MAFGLPQLMVRLGLVTWQSAIGLGVEWMKLAQTRSANRYVAPRPVAHRPVEHQPLGYRHEHEARTDEPYARRRDAGRAAADTDDGVPIRPAPEPVVGTAGLGLLLEAAPGEMATGAFSVANCLAHPISTRVEWSEFIGPAGYLERLQFSMVPIELYLAAEEEVIVRVATRVPAELVPGGQYRGEFSVADLPGTRIFVVVRARVEQRSPSVATDVDPNGAAADPSVVGDPTASHERDETSEPGRGPFGGG